MTASARGLFRATGKVTAPIDTEKGDDLGGDFERPVFLAREKHDFYATPPDVTRVFVGAELDRLREFDMIWESAAGGGAMVDVMREFGLNVFASDLIDRGIGAEIQDYYDYAKAPARATVTNPPFYECGWGNGKARWLKHSLDLLDLDYMALLLNWNWPCAGGLAPFWAEHPPARVYPLRWKIDFTNQGAPPNQHAFFVWDKKWTGETVLRMLDRKDARQSEMF